MGVTELQEQLGISEEAGVSITKRSLKFLGKEKKRYVLSVWNAQLQGLTEL